MLTPSSSSWAPWRHPHPHPHPHPKGTEEVFELLQDANISFANDIIGDFQANASAQIQEAIQAGLEQALETARSGFVNQTSELGISTPEGLQNMSSR